MALIVMVGYPYSGKSTFVDLLVKFYPEPSTGGIHVVRPSDLYPQNIDEYEPTARTDYQIAAWEVAKEKAIDLLKNHDSETIVFDTCGANPYSIRGVIAMANLRHHKTIAIWIATPRSVCRKRGSPTIVDKYIGKFEEAIRWYQVHFDKVIAVKNGPQSILEWEERAKQIVGTL